MRQIVTEQPDDSDLSVALLARSLETKPTGARVLSEEAETAILTELEEGILELAVLEGNVENLFSLQVLQALVGFRNIGSQNVDHLIQSHPKMISATFALRGWVSDAEAPPSRSAQLANEIWKIIIDSHPPTPGGSPRSCP